MQNNVNRGKNGNGSKAKPNFGKWLLAKGNWWVQFTVVAGISLTGLLALGVWTYSGAPPVTSFVSASTGDTVVPLDRIQRGREMFHLRGLMAWGSFWGDGAERGPDFTADALHRTVVSMQSFYEQALEKERPVTQADRDGISVRVRREIKENGYDEAANVIRINDAQIYALRQLETHYTRMFTDPSYAEAFTLDGYITDGDDLRALAAFFYWGGWVAGAARPGETYSYTHNWPYDPDAGNNPTMPTVLWSFLSILALFAGAMLVLYVYGQMKDLPGDPFNGANGGTLTTIELEKGYDFVRPTQRATYKFFAFAVILFVVQVLAGIISAEDFVQGGPGQAIISLFGLSIPFTVARSWHAILQIYWFFMCWV
ncbi:MAG: nitric-oxide reductase, partial [Acidobacteria bacterium]|nr:nitric-oxide reductase [Acidobacteriota bacterium]